METKERELKTIIRIIKEGRADSVSPSEIYDAVLEQIPEKVIIKAPEPASSPERLAYFKQYRLMKKELDKLNADKMKQKEYENKKIKQALKREGFFCYKCKTPIKCNPLNNTYSIERKRNDKHRKIIISNKCPTCRGNLKQFGGYLTIGR